MTVYRENNYAYNWAHITMSVIFLWGGDVRQHLSCVQSTKTKSACYRVLESVSEMRDSSDRW